MLTVGLTGRSGAGKGEVAAILRGLGVPVLDTDLVYRELTSKRSPCLDELEQAFGSSILHSDGSLDRAALRPIVFGDREKLALLNRITHAHILAVCRLWLDEQAAFGSPIAVLDAPQLYESGFDKHCDAVIAVVAPKQRCVQRIMRRDGITRQQAMARLESQHDNAFFRRNADYIVSNPRGIDLVQRQVATVHGELLRRNNENRANSET